MLAIMLLNPLSGAFEQHYYDSRGVVRVYDMTIGDGLWTLERSKADFSALEFAQRFLGRIADDGRSIHGRWETSVDGASWQLDFDLNYLKVS
jgi:hypothetical protein